MVLIPETLRQNAVGEWGEKGREWLSALPSLLEQCRSKWDIVLDESPFALTYNYVTSAQRSDGTAAILKIGCPHPELFTEMNTLRILNGRASARLLESDDGLSAMLLEKISPGTVLKEVQKEDDAKATHIAAELLRDFPMDVPAGYSFPTVLEWTRVFETMKEKMKQGGPLPIAILEKAQALAVELDSTKTASKLLHGDLHHDNILFDEQRGWLSIDPKGVIGDPVYNAARFLNNPNPSLIKMDIPKIAIERRLEILSTVMKCDVKRLAAWAYVDSILTACWWVEAGGTTCNFSLQCAEIFGSILKD